MFLKIHGVDFDDLTTVLRDALVLPPTGTLIYNKTTAQLEVNTGPAATPVWEAANFVFGTSAGTVLEGDNDALYVHIAGAETITGAKTFTADTEVKTGAGSGLAANTGADNFVITSDVANVGASIMAIAGGNANLYFGETGNMDKAGILQYIGSVNELRLGVLNSAFIRILAGLMRIDNNLEVRGQADNIHLKVYSHTVTQGNPNFQMYDVSGAVSWNWYNSVLRASGRDTKFQSVAGFNVVIARSTGATGTRFNDDGSVDMLYDLDVTGNISGTSIESYNVVTKAFADSPYTTADGEVVLCNATGGNMTINLPAAVNGAQVNVKKTDASANTVTIDGAGGDTIDGSLTKVISTQYESLTLVSDGSNWFII